MKSRNMSLLTVHHVFQEINPLTEINSESFIIFLCLVPECTLYVSPLIDIL